VYCPVVHRAVLGLAVVVTACGTTDPTASWTANKGPAATVSGQTFVFGPNGHGLSLAGATIAVAESPKVTTTVAADGTFTISAPSGGPASFSLTQDGFFPNQSATLDITTDGIPMLGFQVPTNDTVDSLSAIVQVTPNPKQCQITTTVSRAGTAPYGGDGLGVDGATVSIDPPVPAKSGPIYFAYGSIPFPDRTLTATSIDGGVAFTNVPVGEYTLSAKKDGVTFSTVDIRCRPGVLVNAAPPHGIQQL
jgi:hypothetical protein